MTTYPQTRQGQIDHNRDRLAALKANLRRIYGRPKPLTPEDYKEAEEHKMMIAETERELETIKTSWPE